MAEAIASIALISVGLTLSFSVLINMGPLSERIDAGAVRVATAERIMERTLALPFDDVVSRKIALDPAEVGGRHGWRAEVRVGRRGPSAKSIEVSVSGGGARSAFNALTARRGGS